MAEAYFNESPYALTQKFDSDKTLDFIRRTMIYPNTEVAVAEYNDRAVGFSIAYLHELPWSNSVTAVIDFIYVDPENRAHGLAEQMIEHQIRWATKNNAVEISAGDVGLRPRLTQRFLEQQGFAEPGIVLRKVLRNEVE